MAIQEIKTYTYQNNFTLNVVQFEKACVVHKEQQVEGYTIYWIKEGEGTYHIDFKSYTFSGGVLFFLSPGQVFSVESEKIKEAYQLVFNPDFYCIQTHDAEIACNGILFNNIYESPFVKPCAKDIVKLEFILENLIEEFSNSDTAKYDMLQAYLKQFIILSVRIQKEKPLLEDVSETKLLKEFSLLVEQNFKKLHSVTDYAERLGISPKSITKHFQKLGNTTPSAYIKNRILLEVKRQLLYSDATIKHIAYDLGFNDPAYFSRFFAKAVGKSPVQFRKEL